MNSLSNYENMDPFMLVSIINLKLRDYYSKLEDLCDDLDISEDILKHRLETIGYFYNSDRNQFAAK